MQCYECAASLHFVILIAHHGDSTTTVKQRVLILNHVLNKQATMYRADSEL